VSTTKQRRKGPRTQEKFGERLKGLRVRSSGSNGKSLTQEGLARALGVSLFTVNGWERLERADTLRTGSLFALSDFFGVEPRWLAQGTGRKRAHHRGS
jgi:DNA-binding XRE family transcriptional regulator